jgi:uncharacterized protein with PQ loop repeat
MVEKHRQHWLDRIAIANGLFSGIALFPQVFKVVWTGDTAGLSLLSFSFIAVNSFIWLLYAMHRGLIALGISSVLNLLASLALICAMLVVPLW